MAKATMAMVCFRSADWFDGSGFINMAAINLWHFFFPAPYLRGLFSRKYFFF
jgi:hypothetical protein